MKLVPLSVVPGPNGYICFFFEILKSRFLFLNRKRNLFATKLKIERIRPRDHVESIDLGVRIFVAPNESSVAALGAELWPFYRSSVEPRVSSFFKKLGHLRLQFLKPMIS